MHNRTFPDGIDFQRFKELCYPEGEASAVTGICDGLHVGLLLVYRIRVNYESELQKYQVEFCSFHVTAPHWSVVKNYHALSLLWSS